MAHPLFPASALTRLAWICRRELYATRERFGLCPGSQCTLATWSERRPCVLQVALGLPAQKQRLRPQSLTQAAMQRLLYPHCFSIPFTDEPKAHSVLGKASCGVRGPRPPGTAKAFRPPTGSFVPHKLGQAGHSGSAWGGNAPAADSKRTGDSQVSHTFGGKFPKVVLHICSAGQNQTGTRVQSCPNLPCSLRPSHFTQRTF